MSSNTTMNLTILAFGNPNSGISDVLGGKELNFTGEGLTCRILDAESTQGNKYPSRSSDPDPQAIMFIVNVANYDQSLPSDPTRNSLQADFDSFSSWANTPRFDSTPIILHLNNVDEFKKKLETIPMRDFFPDYMDGPEYAVDVEYVVKKFVGLSPRANGQIYTYLAEGNQAKVLDFLAAVGKDIL